MVIFNYNTKRQELFPSLFLSDVSMNGFFLVSGDAYNDRQLTPNFELLVEIFCVPTCFFLMIPNSCLSARLSVPREEKSP